MIDLDLTPLATAVLLKRDDDVRGIRGSAPGMLMDRAYGRMTVLHLASNRPAGLS